MASIMMGLLRGLSVVIFVLGFFAMVHGDLTLTQYGEIGYMMFLCAVAIQILKPEEDYYHGS